MSFKKINFLSAFILLSILVSSLPLSSLVEVSAEDKPILELSVSSIIDGIRHHNLEFKVNDPYLKKTANHFDLEVGSPDVYASSGIMVYKGYIGPTLPLNRSGRNPSDLIDYNYKGEDAKTIAFQPAYPSSYSSNPDGYLMWASFTFYKVDYLGTNKNVSSQVWSSIPYESRVMKSTDVSGVVDYYRRTKLAIINGTFNVAPLKALISLPQQYTNKNSYGFDPLTADSTADATYFITGIEQQYDDVAGYTKTFTYDRFEVTIKTISNGTNIEGIWADRENYLPDTLPFKGQEWATRQQRVIVADPSIQNLFNATKVLQREEYGVLPLKRGNGEQVDVYTYKVLYCFFDENSKWAFSYTYTKDGWVTSGSGQNSIQTARQDAITIMKSIIFEFKLLNIKPVSTKLEKFYEAGEGVNLAIIPISLTDAPITHSKDYFEEIAAKVAAFYKEVSYDTLIVNTKVIQIDDAWATVPKNKASYNAGAEITFMNDAIKVVDDKLDFTTYDYNPDNGIGVVVFYTEPNLFNDGAFAYSNGPQPIFDTKDGVKVDSIYQFQQRMEPEAGVTKMARSLCHEFGHVLGKLLVTYNEGSAKDHWWLLPDEYLIGNVKCFQSLMGNLDNFKIERVHPSSYIKEWLGWLSYDEAPVNTTLVIATLDKMSFGDTVYKVSFTDLGSLHSYYIIEYRNALTSSMWDNQFSRDDAGTIKKDMIIYKVNIPNNVSLYSSLNKVWHMFEWNGFLNITSNTFKDPLHKIEFRPVQLGTDVATVVYTNYSPVNLVGGVVDPLVMPPLPEILNDDREFSLPDMDLHAYTSDGKHIGVNYVTGEYENQVVGAVTSGDLIGDSEWIFVPSDITVSFQVSSRDTAAYLNELPEAKSFTNGDTTYSIQVIKYDSLGKEMKSTPSTQTIEAGAETTYTYTIGTGSINVTSKPVKTSTTLSIQISKQEIIEGDSIIISGTVTPKVSSAKVTLTYTKPDTSTINRTLYTDSNGSYTDSYTPSSVGSWNVKASWDGDQSYESTTSNKLSFTLTKKAEQGGGIPGYPILSIFFALLAISIILKRNQKPIQAT